jgi:hypothetical protein
VVAANEGDPVRVAILEQEQEKERFHTVEAPVYKVAHEEIVGVGDIPANLAQLLQLSVYLCFILGVNLVILCVPN